MIGGRVRVRKPFTAEHAEGHGSVGARARGRMGAWDRLVLLLLLLLVLETWHGRPASVLL